VQSPSSWLEMENDKLQKIREERTEIYGDSVLAHRVAGKAVTAILEAHYGFAFPHDIPPHVMAQCNVAVKGLRAVKQAPFHQDNYDDQANYVQLALEADDRKPKEKDIV
jgi:hypothetical protein